MEKKSKLMIFLTLLLFILSSCKKKEPIQVETTETAKISEDTTTEEITTEEKKEWKISEIIANTSESDETTNCESFKYGVDKVYFHFSITDGPSDESLAIRYEGKTPYGDYEGKFDGFFKVNDTLWSYNDSVNTETNEPIPFTAGEISVKYYNDETNDLLGESKVYITNDFDYYMSVIGPALQENYGECYRHSVSDNNIIIEVWMDGVADEVDKACQGDAHYIEMWQKVINNDQQLADRLYTGLEDLNVYNSNCVFRIVDENDHDKVFAGWYNGEITYDIVKDAGY